MTTDELSARTVERAEALRPPGDGQERDDGSTWLTGPGAKPMRSTLVAAIVVVYAWVASAAAPLSTRALIGVLIPGAFLGAVAYGRPPERISPPDSVDVTGLSYWLVAIALLFEWEASAFRDGSPWRHPALTELINPIIAPHEIRTAAFVAWLAAGWALVKR